MRRLLNFFFWHFKKIFIFIFLTLWFYVGKLIKFTPHFFKKIKIFCYRKFLFYRSFFKAFSFTLVFFKFKKSLLVFFKFKKSLLVNLKNFIFFMRKILRNLPSFSFNFMKLFLRYFLKFPLYFFRNFLIIQFRIFLKYNLITLLYNYLLENGITLFSFFILAFFFCSGILPFIFFIWCSCFFIYLCADFILFFFKYFFLFFLLPLVDPYTKTRFFLEHKVQRPFFKFVRFYNDFFYIKIPKFLWFIRRRHLSGDSAFDLFDEWLLRLDDRWSRRFKNWSFKLFLMYEKFWSRVRKTRLYSYYIRYLINFFSKKLRARRGRISLNTFRLQCFLIIKFEFFFLCFYDYILIIRSCIITMWGWRHTGIYYLKVVTVYTLVYSFFYLYCLGIIWIFFIHFYCLPYLLIYGILPVFL